MAPRRTSGALLLKALALLVLRHGLPVFAALACLAFAVYAATSRSPA